MKSPFPEEMNRTVTGAVTNLHFSPTKTSQQNLLKENKSPESIIVTGNTVIDALMFSVNKVNKKDFHDYLLLFNEVWLDFPFGDSVAVYRIGHDSDGKPGKMFALIDENSNPLKISLKCDPLLAEKLREDYETVIPGYHLSKKNWNTIICTGQVPDDELKSLITISYNLVGSR
jgi:predicted DNA-binding protein (MmcQ/YjbR family)